MAQHDYNIANQSGAAFRQDLNNALAAIVSQNSGAAEPSVTYAYQFWADATNGVLKIRNAANSAWITLRELDGTLTIEDGTAAAPGLAFADDLNTGIYSPGADQVAISTGGTQRATVDASGRILVGGTSSRDTGTSIARQIQTEDTTSNAGISCIRNTNDNGGSALVLAKSRGTTSGSNTIVLTNDILGTLSFNGADGTEINNSAASIRAEIDAAPSAGIIPGRLRFFTTDTAGTGTERIRIDSAGLVEIDKTKCDAGGGLDFQPTTANRVVLRCRTSVTTSTSLVTFGNGNGTVGSISVSGTATAYNTSSDYRLKENVTPLTGAAARVQQLKPSRFNFIADPDTEVDGFIAHEVQEIVPEAITGTKDEMDADGNPVYQGIDQSKLVPLLTAALQEAIAKIETLEAKVAALEAA